MAIGNAVAKAGPESLRVYSMIGDWGDDLSCEAFSIWLLAADMSDARRKLAEELSYRQHCADCYKQPENVMTEDGNGCAYLIAAFVSDYPLEGVVHATVCPYEPSWEASAVEQRGEQG
jgi:hypothetical protein